LGTYPKINLGWWSGSSGRVPSHASMRPKTPILKTNKQKRKTGF
jgi:hypothetical protein